MIEHDMWGQLPEPLPHADQRELVRAYQDGDEEALHELVRTNMRYVCAKAQTFDDPEDAFQAGIEGLIHAADRFDLDYNNPFIGYADFWVRAKMGEMAQATHLMKFSDTTSRHILNTYNRVKERLRKAGKPVNAHTLAEHMDATPLQINTALSAQNPTRLETDDYSMLHVLADDGVPPDERVLARREADARQQVFRDFADTLETPRRRAIWYERIRAIEPKTLVELGDDWGVSRERIRQVESEILDDFKEFYDSADHR